MNHYLAKLHLQSFYFTDLKVICNNLCCTAYADERENLMNAEAEVDQEDKEIDEVEHKDEVTIIAKKQEGISFLQAVLIPGVIPVSSSRKKSYGYAVIRTIESGGSVPQFVPNILAEISYFASICSTHCPMPV